MTIVGMWLGLASKPAPEDEKRRREEFSADLARPFLVEEKEKGAPSPFRIIGFMLLTYGLAIAAIGMIILIHYQNARAFRIDLIVAGILIALGILMRLGNR